MTKDAGKTLRLNMPQWQGGNRASYFFGSQLLAWLAPAPNGPVEDVPVQAPEPGETLVAEGGSSDAPPSSARRRPPARRSRGTGRDRIVTIGGDCLVDLAPMAYLNERYCGGLGVLWATPIPTS